MPAAAASTVVATVHARAAPPPLPVLILDDERFDRHRLARLCSGLHFPCDISNATTLGEFSTQLDRHSYALILVDYLLPDGTGLDAIDMVRLSARNLNAATLMISGQADPATPDAVRAAGARFLPKDALNHDSFAAAVREALSDGQPGPVALQDSYSADQVAALMAHCAARSARDVKPMISRMMRQMRDLRAGHGGAEAQAAALRAIEQNCLSLWAFLVEMEREDGVALLAELTVQTSKTRGGPVRATGQTPGKPPSPFGRRPS